MKWPMLHKPRVLMGSHLGSQKAGFGGVSLSLSFAFLVFCNLLLLTASLCVSLSRLQSFLFNTGHWWSRLCPLRLCLGESGAASL